MSYDTLVWVADGARWRVASWHLSLAGREADRERWNASYEVGAGFTKQPNQLLVASINGHKPGTALDIGMVQEDQARPVRRAEAVAHGRSSDREIAEGRCAHGERPPGSPGEHTGSSAGSTWPVVAGIR